MKDGAVSDHILPCFNEVSDSILHLLSAFLARPLISEKYFSCAEGKREIERWRERDMGNFMHNASMSIPAIAIPDLREYMKHSAKMDFFFCRGEGRNK